MIPAALILFALLDATFAGFRAAAGRDGRIAKRGYYVRAMAVGAASGLLVVGLLAAATWVVLRTSNNPGQDWDDLLAIGGRLVLAFGSFSVLVVGALGVYAVSRHEVRTLATVAILGPFTLARPWLVVIATLWATPLASGWRAVALTWVASASMLALGGALDASYRRERAAKQAPISAAQRALELGRPILLLGGFFAAERALGAWALPVAFVSVFASAVAVHDLIHNALYLPRPYDRIALSVYAQLLLKSGHALRESHQRHHRLCLQPEDEEGRVAHEPIPRLLVMGPLLALRARGSAFVTGKSTRAWQVAETGVNLVLLGSLSWAGLVLGSGAALQYLVAVVGVTVTAPVWGAKIPHSIPAGNPAVRWLADRVGRLTPAAASVVFHELHHRAPRVAVALLASRRSEIEARPASPCEPAREVSSASCSSSPSRRSP